MTSAPACANRPLWAKSATAVVGNGFAGLAICTASWANCRLPDAMVARPLLVALGTLTDGMLLLIGPIPELSAIRRQTLMLGQI